MPAESTASDLSDLSVAKIFTTDSGVSRTLDNGAVSRRFLHGAVATGERIRLHESTQPAGTEPNPAHSIDHTELIMVHEGELQFEHDDLIETARAGDLVYVARGTMHSVRNGGNSPLRYTVISIGGDV